MPFMKYSWLCHWTCLVLDFPWSAPICPTPGRMKIPAALGEVQCFAIVLTSWDRFSFSDQKRRALFCSPKYLVFFSIKSYGEVFPWMMVHIMQLISLPWSDKSFNLKELTDECPYFVSWAYFGHNLIIHRKKYFINIRANQQNLIISYWALVNHISWKRYDNKKQNAKETP